MSARPEVPGLERVDERFEGCAIRVLQQVVLALPDLDEAPQLAGALTRPLGLAERCLERSNTDEALDGREQADGIERLAGEGVRARGQSTDAGFLRAADRDDRDRPCLRAFAEALAVEDPVDAGQADVEHDRVGAGADQEALGLDHVLSVEHLDSLELEGRAQQFAERQVVVDDQHLDLAVRQHGFPWADRVAVTSEIGAQPPGLNQRNAQIHGAKLAEFACHSHGKRRAKITRMRYATRVPGTRTELWPKPREQAWAPI